MDELKAQMKTPPADGDREDRKAGSALKVVIAGGGTGGHLFPGIAVAREIRRRVQGVEVLFVVGRRRMEADILARYGYPVTSIDVEGLKGRKWRKGLAVLFKLPKSFFQSVSILRRFSPQLVIGVGGYSSGPFCLAARVLGVPTAVHEQNSFPGLTNRLLCRFVDRVFISFEESREHFPSGSPFLTGNPVREELLLDVAPKKRGGEFTILVVGGSQGARAINEVLPAAVSILNGRGRYPKVIHQTGDIDHARTAADYRERGIEGEIVPFIREMDSAYHRADLVVSRAGATTISELAAMGKPSLLIPYPYAANGHQEVNAESLVRAGGAEMILQTRLDPEGLAEIIMRYMDDPSSLEEMARRASKMGRPDAARVIVDHLMEMVGREKQEGGFGGPATAGSDEGHEAVR